MDEPRSSGFEEWQAELHGHEVVYRMAGSGPPVVLVHGMINSAASGSAPSTASTCSERCRA